MRNRFRWSSQTPSKIQNFGGPPATWNPKHGIVFGAPPKAFAPSTTKQFSTIVLPTTNDVLLHSLNEEDSYATATSQSSSSDKSPTTQDIDESKSISIDVPTTTTEISEKSTSLTFQIPPEVYEEIKNSDEEHSYWSYNLYRGPDGSEHKVTVHYCRSKHTAERVAQYFKDDKVIGFDIEWNPDANRNLGAKQNVSLIQIANERRIALFHVALFAKDGADNLVAPTLKSIMEDANIIKVGVAIKADCTRLRKFLGIDSKGIFELSNLHKLVKYSDSGQYKLINRRLVNLAMQVKEHLGLPLFKGEVRNSDWSQSLNLEQISYAASDSYAGFRLFHIMEAKRKALSPVPPRPHFAEENKAIRLADGVTFTTIDDTAEELEPDAPTTKGSMALDDTSVELEEPDFVITPRPRVKVPKAEKAEKATEVLAAERWVDEWKLTLPNGHKTRASYPNLRAYAMWHTQDIAPPAVAELLKIQPMTVVNYILEAVRLEGLPFNEQKLRELLGKLPESIAKGRYKVLFTRLAKQEEKKGSDRNDGNA
jgi:hypothetical protein